MRVILSQPNVKHVEKTSHPHAGLAYLAAYSIKKGHSTTVIDAKYEGITNNELLNRIVEWKPDIVGFTIRTPDVREAEKLSIAIKKAIPQCVIVVGGAHVTGLKERVLEECRYFDIAVIGEGEETFSELLDILTKPEFKRELLHEVNGIIFQNNGKIVTTDPRSLIQDLDFLPFPAWNMFPKSSTRPLFTSRGCPFKCIFCQRVMGNKVRSMSPERVLQEMKWNIEQHGCTFFQIEDEVFGVNRKWINRVLDLMIEQGIHKKVKWFANSRVNIANLELFKKMRNAGCVAIGLGIESGNQEILDAIRKDFKLQQAYDAIKMAKQAGLITFAFFILGHPNETKRTIRDTINFACKLNPTEVTFGIMIPYPGTEIYEMAKRREGGYKSLDEDWEKFTKHFGKGIELEELSSKDLNRYQKQAYLEFYIRNFRIKDFYIFLKRYLRILTIR